MDDFDALDTLCTVSIQVKRLEEGRQLNLKRKLRGKRSAAGDDNDATNELDDLETGPSSILSKGSFVHKLLEMLGEPQTQLDAGSAASGVHWGCSGRSIVIDDPSAFSQTMLPRFFKHKYALSPTEKRKLFAAACTRASRKRRWHPHP